MKKLALLATCSILISPVHAGGLIGSTGSSTPTVQSTSLKQWHTLVTDIARFLTGNESYDKSWVVEYNSRFTGMQPGTALQALSNGSGLNVISKRCALDNPELITTEAQNFGSSNEKGQVGFSAGVSIPSFISSGLASANAGLRINRNRITAYEFSNVAVSQIDEGTALEVVNSRACFNSIKHRSEVYIVRGVLNMQLSMSQGLSRDFDAGLNLKTKKAADVGFDVSWDSQSNWIMQQNQPRPWFRIVTKMKLNQKLNRYELAN